MTEIHPITPPDELVQHWESIAYAAAPVPYTHHIARCAARWGWDQRGAAKPPSLKEQALEALKKIEDNEATYLDSSIIRRALEQLDD